MRLKLIEERNGSLFYLSQMIEAKKLEDFILVEEDSLWPILKEDPNSSFEDIFSRALTKIYSKLDFDAYSLNPNYGFNIDGLTRYSGNLYKILEDSDGVH